MRRAHAFLVRKWHWVRKNRLLWWGLLFVAITLALLFLWRAPDVNGMPSDFRIRAWGLLLQMVGGVTVLYDLTSSASASGHQGVVRSFIDWLREGFRGKNVTVYPDSARMEIRSGSPRVKVRQPLRAAAPHWEQIRTLAENIERVDADLDDAFREVDKVKATLRSEVLHERDARRSELEAIRHEIKRLAVGNFAVLFFGALCVLVGLVLATLAPEIALAAAGRWTDLFARL